MARAYICLARNDLDDNLLQVLDLKPNSSQFVPSLSSPGQTGYVTWEPQNDTVATTAPGGVITLSAAYKGLAAYLIDNVEDADNANICLTAARANGAAVALVARVAAGSTMTSAAIDGVIQAQTGGVASGLAAGNSTGSVEEVLRILSGEVYYVPAGATSGAAAAFVAPHYPRGQFLSETAVGKVTVVAPNVNDVLVIGGVKFIAKATADVEQRHFSQAGTNAEDAASLVAVINAAQNQKAIAAQNGGVTVKATVVPGSNIVKLTASQIGTAGAVDLSSTTAARLPVSGTTLTFVAGESRKFRAIVDTGYLHASALNGALSKVKSASYSWKNPSFTYSATGTAKTVDGGTQIPSTGVFRAVTIYDNAGNVI